MLFQLQKQKDVLGAEKRKRRNVFLEKTWKTIGKSYGRNLIRKKKLSLPLPPKKRKSLVNTKSNLLFRQVLWEKKKKKT